MGPLNDADEEGDDRAAGRHQVSTIDWTTLGEYLDYLVQRGISTNVASFVGATTVRVHEIGYDEPRADAGGARADARARPRRRWRKARSASARR